MEDDNLLEIVFDLTTSIAHAQNYKTDSELVAFFEENGFYSEEIMEIAKFIEENISEDEYEEVLEKKSLENYLNGLKRMREHIKMINVFKEFTLEQNEDELWKKSEVKNNEVDRENA